MSLYVCEECREAVEAEAPPRGWEGPPFQPRGARGPWWCGDCVEKVIGAVLDEYRRYLTRTR